jgi:pimeloyl-ACP methyl ester carboxylesterase
MRDARRFGLLSLLLLTACSSSDDPRDGAGAGGASATADQGGGGGQKSDAGGTGSTDIQLVQVDARGFSFDVRVAGPEAGEVVFLLHGFPETSYEWRHLMPVLASAGYRAIAPNQRGYSPGARPPNVEGYVVTELVLDITALADAVGADTFHVVGHDWGAPVAWGLAGAFPQRVKTVVPISVPHPDAFRQVLSDQSSCQYSASSYFDLFSQPGFEDTLLENDAASLRGLLSGLDQDAVDDYVSVLGTPEALGAALNWYRANVADRNLSAPELGPVTLPTTYIWSDGDVALCRDGADLTGDYVTGPYVFDVIEGVDHWVPENAPDDVASAVMDRIGG